MYAFMLLCVEPVLPQLCSCHSIRTESSLELWFKANCLFVFIKKTHTHTKCITSPVAMRMQLNQVTLHSDDPISHVGKISFQLQFVHELLICNVEGKKTKKMCCV